MQDFSFKNIEIINKISKFSNNYMVFYSVYIGVKKSMDLWIDNFYLNEFIDFCNQHKIFYKYDVKFVESKNYDVYKNVIGSENLTTTKIIGEEVSSKNAGKIHFFIGMDEETVQELYKYGWYPVVVKNRVIYKNFHDLSEFGKHLGYPLCCTKFFFEKNDWRYFNFPYEIYKNSKKIDYRCNPFWKDHFGISYIYHMPCSFSCENTINYAQKIIDKLKIENKNLVKEIEKKLLLPILSIREQKLFAFEGEVGEDSLSIKYTEFYELGSKFELDINEYLKKGNLIKIENEFVRIYYGNELVFSYNTKKSNEIEIPFIVKFHKYG